MLVKDPHWIKGLLESEYYKLAPGLNEVVLFFNKQTNFKKIEDFVKGKEYYTTKLMTCTKLIDEEYARHVAGKPPIPPIPPKPEDNLLQVAGKLDDIIKGDP